MKVTAVYFNNINRKIVASKTCANMDSAVYWSVIGKKELFNQTNMEVKFYEEKSFNEVK